MQHGTFFTIVATCKQFHKAQFFAVASLFSHTIMHIYNYGLWLQRSQLCCDHKTIHDSPFVLGNEKVHELSRLHQSSNAPTTDPELADAMS